MERSNGNAHSLNSLNVKQIKDRIEEMDKLHQIEVLRLLKQHSSVILNENNNGVFINITDLDPKIIKQLDNYIKYVDNQTINIESIETQKNIIENTFFNKGNKEKSQC
jgi:hypothetical protein